jgi:bifunctional non-homologous end joining protein LigD
VEFVVAFQRKTAAAIGVKAPYPGFVEPALATSTDKVPSGERWIHEIKFDGYRVQLHIHNDAIKVLTRRGIDWTRRFSKIAADAYLINAGSAIIDGEIVVPAADGTTDFSVLQNELRGKSNRYLSGRGRDWVKKTCAQRETLTIAGFALDGNDWDGIYVGRRKGDDLIYAGKVDHGFDKKSSTELRKRLTPLIRKTQPYTKRIAHKGIWVEPRLNAEIEYRAKSAEGKVRHPFFKGLREDL